jgi:hypothetical protein
MQTFLPYSDFKESAKVLDTKRLGKQRVEAMQIVNCIQNRTGWQHHPIVRMWTPNVESLMYYHNVIIDEWISRGFRNNMPHYHINSEDVDYPGWLGKEKIHKSHRSNLLRKSPKWYSKFGWEEDDSLPYVWVDMADNRLYVTQPLKSEKVYLD